MAQQTFRRWLEEGLASIDIAKTAPSTLKDPKDGEELIMTITDEYIRRLFLLQTQLDATGKEMATAATHAMIDNPDHDDKIHDPSACAICDLVTKMADLQYRLAALGALLWAEIKMGLSEDQRETMICRGLGLGIRTDWRVVSLPPRPRVQVLRVGNLRELFDVLGDPTAGGMSGASGD